MTFSIKNSLFFDIFHYNSETAATILIKLYMKNHWGSGMLHDQSSFWLKCAEGPPMSFSTQNSLNFNIFHYNLEMAPSIWTKFEMKNHWGSGMMHGQSSFWLKCSEGPPPMSFSTQNSLIFDIFRYNLETAATILIKLDMKNHWGSGMMHDQSSFWLKCSEVPP